MLWEICGKHYMKSYRNQLHELVSKYYGKYFRPFDDLIRVDSFDAHLLINS